MTKQELKNYLIEEAEYSETEVENMSAFEMLDAYLAYNGIQGFTHDICDVVEATSGVDLRSYEFTGEKPVYYVASVFSNRIFKPVIKADYDDPSDAVECAKVLQKSKDGIKHAVLVPYYAGE